MTGNSRFVLSLPAVVLFILSYRLFFISPSLSNHHESFNSYEHNSPLFEAVKSNDIVLVRTLITEGVFDANKNINYYYNINAEDPSGITPLIEATLLGNVELVELLLQHAAHVQPLPGFRHTPLRAACLTANTQLISLLLQKGADPNAQSEGGRTPLMGACYLRPQYDALPNRSTLSFEAVKIMLEDSRTNPTIRNDFGESALDLCRERGYNESVALLETKTISSDTSNQERMKWIAHSMLKSNNTDCHRWERMMTIHLTYILEIIFRIVSLASNIICEPLNRKLIQCLPLYHLDYRHCCCPLHATSQLPNHFVPWIKFELMQRAHTCGRGSRVEDHVAWKPMKILSRHICHVEENDP